MESITRHQMPFGAELQPDGTVRFRLWAPAATGVELCLGPEAEPLQLPMRPTEEGWFELHTDQAGSGSRYRFRIDGGLHVPDPASRFQPEDVHAASEVIDPAAWEWRDQDWRGRPWEETILYELHVGCFTPQGSFRAVQEKLDYLLTLGITALELMPVADFPGSRNWGYDGTYLFAPDSRYGRPEDLKALIDAAHARGLMVFLDVVYNHFGPEGNYLHTYAPQFFSPRHHTPWGAGINFDGPDSRWVRSFYIHNALYWLEEYHLDGLRLDAVHAILDDSQPDILVELAEAVRQQFGDQRHIHLVLENDHNAAHYLTRDAGRPRWYDAQWNDDLHHALHVLLTGERSGYYQDYAQRPVQQLQRCLAEGFAYQGEASGYRDGAPRGEPSAHLPPIAFVSFLQNHDQVGNRALGERIHALAGSEPVRAALVLLLLAPAPPLLFMGQELGSRRPFAYFCDFGPDLAEKVIAGRRREFARFAAFADPDAWEHFPNPMDVQTFHQAVLDWNDLERPEPRTWLQLHRELLAIRQRELVPRLHGLDGRPNSCTPLTERALSARWSLGDGAELLLLANLGAEPLHGVELPRQELLYATHAELSERSADDPLPPWSVVWYLHRQGPRP